MSEESKAWADRQFARKLTARQKDEVFAEYVGLYSRREQLHYPSRKAQELGVSYDTVKRIINDPKRWAKFKAKCERIYDREMARAYAHLPDALDVPLSIIRDADSYEGGLKQYPLQAANSLMDRLNFRERSEDKSNVAITFTGGAPLTVNMPPPTEETESGE